MDYALSLAAIAALIAFIVLTIFVMVSLASSVKLIKDISYAIGKITVEFSQINENLNKTMQDISELKRKAIETLENADVAITEIKSAAGNIENKTLEILNIFKPFEILANSVYNKIAPPVSTTATIISGVFKAVTAFTSHFTSDKKK